MEVRENDFQAEMKQIDRDYENLDKFRRVTCFVDGLYEITDEVVDSVIAVDKDLNRTVEKLEEATQLLIAIRGMLQERRVRRGKKDFHKGSS